MSKDETNRLTETIDYIRNDHVTSGIPFGNGNTLVAQALTAWLGTLSAHQKSQLSAQMAQGGRQDHWYWRSGAETLERKKRRALVLVFAWRHHSHNPVLAHQFAMGPNATAAWVSAQLDLELSHEDASTAVPAANAADYRRHDPLKIGISIGQYGQSGPGTVTCYCRDNAGRSYLLSNDHVLRQVWGADGRVIQPGQLHAGPLSNDVATYVGGFLAANWDCGLAELNGGRGRQNQTPEGDVVAGINNAVAAGDVLFKRGSMSGRRVCTVICPDWSTRTGCECAGHPHGVLLNGGAAIPHGAARGGDYHFDHQIKVARRDAPLAPADPAPHKGLQCQGDSGSLLFDTAGRAVGMLHGGGDNRSDGLAQPIAGVLTQLSTLRPGLTLI